ncbi:GNAT family N-acetyltransferase [Rhodococcus sp. X156]|uniref:GNAT family N-acetyltransferase n=1 Tax=Rhodococcus sp. X156 TaxID=2499145 RepID=UPI000FDA2CFD|nr:GNAT family N-acetyltransferase [Rhodococcus sp. X156]
MALAAVRPAQPADCAAMAAVQLAVWRGPYAAFLPPAVIAELDPDTAALAWHRAVTGSGDAQVLVATEREEVVGFTAGAGDEVSTLLVEPRWTRRGHGGRLLGSLAGRLRTTGALQGQVWVVDADTAGRAFYPRHSWLPDGTVRTSQHGPHALRELRHVGSLTARWE